MPLAALDGNNTDVQAGSGELVRQRRTVNLCSRMHKHMDRSSVEPLLDGIISCMHVTGTLAVAWWQPLRSIC